VQAATKLALLVASTREYTQLCRMNVEGLGVRDQLPRRVSHVDSSVVSLVISVVSQEYAGTNIIYVPPKDTVEPRPYFSPARGMRTHSSTCVCRAWLVVLACLLRAIDVCIMCLCHARARKT